MPDGSERKDYAEMTGEILREVAVLFGVFILLDVGLAAWEGELSLSLPQIIVLVAGDVIGSTSLALLGMFIENRR